MLLAVKQMQVNYGSQRALEITRPIVFGEGERIGVIGSNGAGKSTLVKALLGLVPYQGSVSTQLKKEDMAVHMQTNEYASTMAVKHIMEMLLNTRIKGNRELTELIDFFGFEGCLNKRYRALSGGEKQKFTIILVMMQKARLTIYDEVTSGLDFETRQKLMERLVRWYRDKEDTLLVISHYYDELEQLADKLLVLDQGRVVAFGGKDELFHTYCGRVIYVIDNQEATRRLVEGFRLIKAPEHLLAISAGSREEEEKITSVLLKNDVNFKRSHSDIEIMFMNAKERFYQEQEGKGA